MAKFFLILFSGLLSLSLVIFAVSNFTNLMKEPSPSAQVPSLMTKEEQDIAQSLETKTASTKQDAENLEVKKDSPVAAAEVERFQPDAEEAELSEEEKVAVKKPIVHDSLDFASFYIKKIKPFIQRIFGEEEVEIKTQNKVAKDTSIDAEKQISPNTSLEPKAEEDKSVLNNADAPTLEPKKQATDLEAKPKSLKPTNKDSSKNKAETKPAVTTVKPSTASPASKWKVPAKGTGWGIQVAAFRTEKEANIVIKQLENEKIPNYTYEVQVDGATWYRVTIGPFDSPGSAAAYKQSRNIGRKYKGAFVRKL